jgi:hypothetical protein
VIQNFQTHQGQAPSGESRIAANRWLLAKFVAKKPGILDAKYGFMSKSEVP